MGVFKNFFERTKLLRVNLSVNTWNNTRENYDGTGTLTIYNDKFYFNKVDKQEPFYSLVNCTIDSDDLKDEDGVCYDPDDNGTCQDFTLDANSSRSGHQPINGTQLRFGRLKIKNAYGSEMIDLPVNIRTEYYTGDNFETNKDDDCTKLSITAPVNHIPLKLQGTSGDWEHAQQEVWLKGEDANGTTKGLGLNKTGQEPYNSNFIMSEGKASLVLDAPEENNTGFIYIQGNLTDYPWLQYDWNGNGTFTENPNATATFGIYKGNEHIMYQQETTWK